MNARELTNYLNAYLRIGDVQDYQGAFNGQQVEGSPVVTRVAMAVDACQFTIDAAVAARAELLIVHHGLFWGPTAPVTERYYHRLSALIKHDIGLYSCHLPLDAHPEVGNNHVLARMLGLKPNGVFGAFEGVPIGVYADARRSREALIGRVREALQVEPLVIATGPTELKRIGVLTGGGGSLIAEAAAAGLDMYITGEGAHHTYFEAEERGLNVIYAGHYATETVGVKALGEHLKTQFGLEVQFIDHPTGL